MQAKKHKLADQNGEIREILKQRHKSMKTDIFKGVSINVNGRTKPTADELKRLVLLNGGEYHPYYRYQTTKFMIATNLAFAKIKQLRPDDRIVRPEWITDSIAQGRLLPYKDYQIFSDQPRGKSSVIELETNVSSLDGFEMSEEEASNHTRRQFRKQNLKKNKSILHREPPKSRDIRNMFTTTTKNLQLMPSTSKFKPEPIISESSNDSTNVTTNETTNHDKSDYKPIALNQPIGPANICGVTDLDSICGLLVEWVGCPEGITDEDTACVTKYFFNLMNETDYQARFFEIFHCLRERVVNHGEKKWLETYNNIIDLVKGELSNGSETSLILAQMLFPIDLSEIEAERRS